jgi:hypothetical protein
VAPEVEDDGVAAPARRGVGVEGAIDDLAPLPAYADSLAPDGGEVLAAGEVEDGLPAAGEVQQGDLLGLSADLGGVRRPGAPAGVEGPVLPQAPHDAGRLEAGVQVVADQGDAVIAVADGEGDGMRPADPPVADRGEAGGVEGLAVELLGHLETAWPAGGGVPQAVHLFQGRRRRRLGQQRQAGGQQGQIDPEVGGGADAGDEELRVARAEQGLGGAEGGHAPLPLQGRPLLGVAHHQSLKTESLGEGGDDAQEERRPPATADDGEADGWGRRIRRERRRRGG